MMLTRIINKINYELSKYKNRIMHYRLQYISQNIYIRSIDETLDKLCSGRVSMSRFGDGEFGVIESEGNGFQKSDKALAKRLSEVLRFRDREDYIVCLPDMWGDMEKWNSKARSGWFYVRSNNKFKCYNILAAKLRRQNAFFNAHVTRLYNDWIDKRKSSDWFTKIKKIWKDKDLLIIEGEFSKLGVGNDLFSDANSIIRIICPSENAYDRYTDILNTVKEYAKNKLILIALGQTATVLAFDLYRSGFYALDIGHIDIEYEWFLKKATDKINISGKYVNEASDKPIIEERQQDDEDYIKQIVAKIV